jgi:hypothetical protein
VIVCAPAESALAYWAREHPAAVILLDVGDHSGLREAIAALAYDPEKRRALGRRSRAAGEQFDYARVRDTFLRALATGAPCADAGRSQPISATHATDPRKVAKRAEC